MLLRASPRWLSSAAQALIWGILLALLAVLALPHVSPFDVLIVRGGSMNPTIQRGAVAIIDRHARSPRVGDIVAFHEPPDVLVTHRVVALRDGGFITRGDANRTDDPLVRRPGDVLGTFVLSVPYMGYVLHVLEQPLIFFLLLAATGGYLVAGELRVIWREVRNLRRPSDEAKGDA